MTTDALALCGCVSAEARNDSRVSLGANRGGAVTGVSIVNFMCPLGSAGIAQVMVKNGIAHSIFY